MSQAYCELTGESSMPTTNAEMREFSKRPGKTDKDGKIVYFTEQSHKDKCDVNNIIKKYDQTGLLIHINQFEAKFGDMTGNDYKEMLDKVIQAKENFNELPNHIRKRFMNNPEELLRFMEDPNNREEAIKLGLVDKMMPENADGLGEHALDRQKEMEKAIAEKEK